MKANIKQIIEFIDAWLLKNNKEFLTPPDANDLLDKAGLLKDRKERPGIELRKLLRAGLLPHAYKIGYNWFIPYSGNQIPKIEEKVAFETNVKNTSSYDLEIESLMDLNKFKRVCDLSKENIPTSMGLYAITIDNEDFLPEPFSMELRKRNHKLLYIGITVNSLRTRLWESELHCKKPATFFRSIGAILGFTPEPCSLKANTRNYKFSSKDQKFIEQWMADHLLVNFMSFDENLDDIEKQLISEYKPIINIKDNPYKMPELEELRNNCVAIGRTGYGIL